MKTKRAIVLSDSLPGNFTAYSAEDLRDEIVEMRDLVRALLRSAPEDFYMGVADVMKKLFRGMPLSSIACSRYSSVP